MSYSTPENYIAYFTRRDATGVTAGRGEATPDEDRIAYHLQAASDRIDSYISARYRLPLTDIPCALRDYCCDIARYLLTGTERKCTDEIRLRYEDAMDWLKLVASGKVGIGTNAENGGTVDSSAPDVAFYSGGEDVWSRNRTGGGCY